VVNLALLQSWDGDLAAALVTLYRALTCSDVPAKAYLHLALLLNHAGRAAEAASPLEIYLGRRRLGGAFPSSISLGCGHNRRINLSPLASEG